MSSVLTENNNSSSRLEKGYSEQDDLFDGNSQSLPKSPHSTDRETEAQREQRIPSGTQVLLLGKTDAWRGGGGEPQVFVCSTIELKKFL